MWKWWLNEKSAEDGLRGRADCQEYHRRTLCRSYDWHHRRDCECREARRLQQRTGFIRHRWPLSTRRQTRNLAAGAIARGGFGNLSARMLASMHHRAVIAAAMARHSCLGTAAGNRREWSRKQQQRKHCSSEFNKSIHGYILILRGSVPARCDFCHNQV